MDWAEPEVEVDEDTMATVKILYVRNLMLQTTEETIEKEFNSLRPGTQWPAVIAAPPTPAWKCLTGCGVWSVSGTVERVKKIRDYAFVHFTQREHAIHAMKTLNGKVVAVMAVASCNGMLHHVANHASLCTQVVDGSPIEVTLAKPVDKDSYVRYTRGTGGRGGSLLQSDYPAYTLGQVRPLVSNSRSMKTHW